jgi:ABC-2 type transport system permease protein
MTAVVHTLALTRRSVRGRLRQPAALTPSFVFPLFFAALGSASFSRVAQRPDFADIAPSFLNYAVAGAIVQGVLFASTSAAGDLATDIDQGFFERLLASPVSRTSILLGRLGSAMVVAVVQVTVFLGIFLAFGARIETGVIGFVGLVVAGALLALAMSGLMSGIAIRSGSPEVVQGAFPLVFALMFLSSAFFPRQYMTGWYQDVATWNPMSHVVEGMQGFMNQPLHVDQFLRAWLIPLAIVIVSLAFALRALSNRLAAM